MLNKNDIQTIKKAVHMINNHTDKNKVSILLDNCNDISEVLAVRYSIYTNSIFYQKAINQLQNDIISGGSDGNPFSNVVINSKVARKIYNDYDYPIVQYNNKFSLSNEVSMPTLKHALLSLVKQEIYAK